MKRVAIVGHRGVGKSSFLTRVRAAYESVARPVRCLDLDHEIERRQCRTVSDIFRRDGEAEFRRVEDETFIELDKELRDFQGDVYLACGGGFEPSKISAQWNVLWLRRASDSRGRIFTDRPRLNAGVSALQEFQERFTEREPKFRKRASEMLFLDEGLAGSEVAERAYILGQIKSLGGTITLMPEHFARRAQLVPWLAQRLEWGIASFELRDDLLSENEIEFVLQYIPRERVLMSFRDPARRAVTERLVKNGKFDFDWPLEMGKSPLAEPRFLSWHRREKGQSLRDALAMLPVPNGSHTQLKAALPTHDFRELLVGHEWQKAAPGRVFLPHSKEGRWSWYRLLRAHDQALGFFRDGEGSSADQPTTLQWIRQQMLGGKSKAFAAILGDPVSHSRTPIEQADFFANEFSTPVLAIRIAREEWSDALTTLTQFGLRWAAVTAPLKALAFEFAKQRDALSEKFGTANTLALHNGIWHCTNTDIAGFQAVVAEAAVAGPIVIWGGGGTLEIMRDVLPKAYLYSARTGSSRTEVQAPPPEAVVWASGGEGTNQIVLKTWQPKLVIDLDYSEDAPARALALEWQARYISGLTMFRAQAEAQRKFWSGFKEKS